MKFIIQILFLFTYFSIECQSIKELENSLIKKLELVQVEKNYKKALIYNEDFKLLLAKTLEKKEAYNYDFDSLSKFMSTVKSQDGFFRLFNWNIQLKNQKQHYDCWIYFSDKSIIKLKDSKNKSKNIEFISLEKQNWLGALYFDIIDLKKKNKTIYTLLG